MDNIIITGIGMVATSTLISVLGATGVFRRRWGPKVDNLLAAIFLILCFLSGFSYLAFVSYKIWS